MSTGQYRALVAYLNYWPQFWDGFTLDQAISDVGISLDRESVLDRLAKAGHDWDEENKILTYDN